MTIKKGSNMITFEKEGMKDVLLKVSNWFEDEHSPYFYLGERWFPVIFWHETGDLSFFGKDWDIISLDNNLKVKKGVRLR